MKVRKPQDFLLPQRFFSQHVERSGAVPAYVYHQFDPSGFGEICAAIARREIPTLTYPELLGGASRKGRAVLLSADDGWSSTWSIAFPLLRRHGLRMTLFLPPLAIEDSDECRPGLDQGIDPAELEARDRGDRGLLTWGEVRAMHASGLVDVQSHALHHGVIFVAERLVDFERSDGPFPLDGNAGLLSRIDGRDVYRSRPEAGTPIYEWGKALEAPQRYLEPGDARERCVEIVREAGAERFFASEGWEQILREACAAASGSGRFESPAERRVRYRHELLEARRMLEQRVPGARVRVLAPPWARMHAELPAIAREVGYELIVLGYPFRPVAGELPCHPRLFGDAIWTCLRGPLGGLFAWERARRRSIARRAAGGVP